MLAGKIFIKSWLPVRINLSTRFFNFSIPNVVRFDLNSPSKANGLVIIAIVLMPLSFRISATTGVAPVPQPQPKEEIRIAISVSLNKFSILLIQNSAYCFPVVAAPPQPKP